MLLCSRALGLLSTSLMAEQFDTVWQSVAECGTSTSLMAHLGHGGWHGSEVAGGAGDSKMLEQSKEVGV